ncbi:uncharacterized protein TNIN_61631 [Trichonephila inaurata madagascariensis]|uniref:Reverse transcriptase domain-containing protein n=1 Tax=Trichonephila inaurata madagascariensis TaxID=2747483 RepID=A0A8X6X5R2_9ARAC|nr:uncharacterized protein TNIN_61631 [Trichonephila inaurata madagascariensis]
MSEEQKESIKVARGRVKASLTRLENGADDLNLKNEILEFLSKFEDWINFKDLFVTAVHSQTSLSNIQKFQYLKGLLSDEPVSLIKHIPLSNESYEEAWGKLIDRYNKKKQIVYALIKTFLDQKDISQVNMTNLRNLVHTSDKVLRGLKTLGTEAMNRDPRVLLDSGSESSFISENAINILGLKRCNDRLFLSGISGIQAGTTPDEDFSRPSECDVILGSNCFFSILRNGRITGSKGQPIAQSTIFGWVVADCKPQNPKLSSIIQNSFYIDDLMLGASSNKEAIILIQTLFEALNARGFHLRKWRSNSRDVLINLSKNLEFNEPNVEIHPENCSKALGLIWDSKEDIGSFSI